MKSYLHSPEVEDKHMKEIKNVIFEGLMLAESEYVQSFQKHARNPEFAKLMKQSQEKIAEDILPDKDSKLPEGLTKEKALEIRDFAKLRTNQIMQQLSAQIQDPTELRAQINYQIARLDDVIFLEYGFRNHDVIKAFNDHGIICKEEAPASAPAQGAQGGLLA